jgi:hypothetical protein
MIKIIICVSAVFITLSCAKKQEATTETYAEAFAETVEEENTDSNQILAENKNTIDINREGLISDNNVRIRSNPSTDAEIIGMLNTDDYVSILEITEKKQLVDNSWDYWYKIKTSENITGWVFGKYVYLIKPGEPFEFANNKWLRYFGALLPKENIELADIQGCSWHNGFTYLIFSKEGNYAIGERWTGPKYGVYELHDNVIYFTPAFSYFINSVEHQIDKLYYSNEMHYNGAPVLKNINENLEFYPRERRYSELGETVRINGYYCEKINEKTKLNTNNILYLLPDRASGNRFDNSNYYGNISMKADTRKLAKIQIDGVLWYYVVLDFTTEPIDGGGPYFFGWLSEEYFE